jgi:hypothetical protein
MTYYLRELEYREKGRAIGRAESLGLIEKRLADLLVFLIVEKRNDDLKQALLDKSYREQLYEEYGI